MQSAGKPADYDAATDSFITPMHPPRKTEGGTWERGGQNRYTTRMHKSETLDYGILLSGERVLHHRRWPARAQARRRRGADRKLARLVQSEPGQPDGLRHDEREFRRLRYKTMDAKSVSRIVVVDEGEHSQLASDAVPAERPLTDPARPGFASARIWVTDRTPARLKGLRESLSIAAHARAAARRIGLPHRHVSAGCELSVRSVGSRDVASVFRRDRLTRGVDLFGHAAASLHAENPDARFLPDPRRRDHAGPRQRGGRT